VCYFFNFGVVDRRNCFRLTHVAASSLSVILCVVCEKGDDEKNKVKTFVVEEKTKVEDGCELSCKREVKSKEKKKREKFSLND
jgi:hypothetical protein